MSQMPRKKVIAAAIILGLVTGALIYLYMGNLERQAHASVQIVTAAEDIASQAIIKEGMLKIQSFPRNAIPAGAVASPESVMGMVALSPIKAGEAISKTNVGPAHRLAYRVPSFMRAVTVALDPIIGVGGFIKPGDHVDVVATFKVDKGSVTKTVLQDVELLATGAEVVASDPEPDTGRAGKAQSIPNATLAVTPTDAEKLILAESRGKLRLTLRGSEDSSFISSNGVTSRSVLGNVPPDVPEKAEPKSEPANSAPTPKTSVASRDMVPPTPLPWQVEPAPGIGAMEPTEPEDTGKVITVVRGTKVEETVVPE